MTDRPTDQPANDQLTNGPPYRDAITASKKQEKLLADTGMESLVFTTNTLFHGIVD